MSQRKQNQAFTTIELLVVIGILVVLMGIAFVAFHGVKNSSAKRSTEVALANLKGMVANLEAANGLKSQPVAWLWLDQGGAIVNPPAAAPAPGSPVAYTPEFWKLPYRAGNTSLGDPHALSAPGNVADDALERNASIAVLNTSLAMAQLAALPINKQAIEKTSLSSLYMPEHQGAGGVLNGAGDGWIGFATDNPQNVGYVQGVHIKYRDKLFVATAALGFNANATPSVGAGTGSAWYDESGNPLGSPIMLDGWHNPIIFVPGTGLKVRLVNGKKQLDMADAAQNRIIVSPEGKVDYSNPANPRVVTPGRPFWASAGPDGDFSKGDDNVYSFGE